MKKLPYYRFSGISWGVQDEKKFRQAIDLLKDALVDGHQSLVSSDNLITWGRNLSFLQEDAILDILNDSSKDIVEKSIVWRTYVLLYIAQISLSVAGDFVECGVYRGHTALQLCKNVLLTCGRKLFLYDRFEHKISDENHSLPALHDADLHASVTDLFSEFSFVSVVKGDVPSVFKKIFPDVISFAHIDMNSASAEAAAIEAILPRLSRHGVVIFDDYGWHVYSEQKAALDPIVHSFGQKILELPTGQGLLLKV